MMSKEMDFFIYLIENYASYKGKNASEIMKELEELGLVDLIYQMYERYHQEAIENAYNDIDKLITETSNSIK